MYGHVDIPIVKFIRDDRRRSLVTARRCTLTPKKLCLDPDTHNPQPKPHSSQLEAINPCSLNLQLHPQRCCAPQHLSPTPNQKPSPMRNDEAMTEALRSPIKTKESCFASRCGAPQKLEKSTQKQEIIQKHGASSAAAQKQQLVLSDYGVPS